MRAVKATLLATFLYVADIVWAAGLEAVDWVEKGRKMLSFWYNEDTK